MFKRSGTILTFGMNAIILTTLVAISNGMASPTPQQEIMELVSINDQQVIVLKEIVTVETEVVKLVSDADDPRLEAARNRFLDNPNDYSEEFCLAQNIYFEASIDNLAGMAAVANTVLNRVEDSSYPDSVCGVIHQGQRDSAGNMVRNKCQFSWYCDGKSDRIPESEAWEQAKLVAWNMMHTDLYRGLAEGATHYHATYVDPYWAASDDMVEVGQIGKHIFYRYERS